MPVRTWKATFVNTQRAATFAERWFNGHITDVDDTPCRPGRRRKAAADRIKEEGRKFIYRITERASEGQTHMTRAEGD